MLNDSVLKISLQSQATRRDPEFESSSYENLQRTHLENSISTVFNLWTKMCFVFTESCSPSDYSLTSQSSANKIDTIGVCSLHLQTLRNQPVDDVTSRQEYWWSERRKCLNFKLARKELEYSTRPKYRKRFRDINFCNV